MLEVLLVEDNSGDVRLLREMFAKEPPGSFALTHFQRMGEALAHLATERVDILLLDMGLPDAHGLETLHRALVVAPGVPVIVLTGMEDEALAAQAMNDGAQDYLIKGQIESRALPRALRHAIERHRLHAQAETIRTQQLLFKDEFLSHVSHELRSPLNAIYQFSTIMLDGLAGELRGEQREYLEIVVRNAGQLRSMIDDLLEVTRLQAGKLTVELQRTALDDAVHYVVDTLQTAAAAKGVHLYADTQSELPFVTADPTRLRQILVILVDNAIKFTAAGGVVKVAARFRAEHPDVLLLEVSDSGSGFDPALVSQIFDRLYQVSDTAPAGRNGLGLGLYICKDLVARQGGQITAQSAPGKGSVFSVTLPVFSLPHLLVRSLRNGRPTSDPVTLVVTEIGSPTGWLSDEVRAEHSQGVRDLLQECLHSDRDVLLPRMGATGAAELFFIVAVTDAIGGTAISQRIRDRWSKSDPEQRASLTLTTSCQALEAIEHDADDTADAYLEKTAARIQLLMNEEISSRTSLHG